MELLITEGFKYAVLGGFALLGWLSRELWGMVKELKNDLVELRSQINEHYVRRDDFKEVKDMLMDILRRIESKLDGKVDK
jgi:hypothetical protein